jgi:hypothetical protein
MNDLTAEQKDYAIFLPALSSFYSTFIGKQRFGKDYVDPSRIPAHLQMPDDTLEKLNWLSPDGVFQYKWSLYSAGHANLDLNTHIEKEDMVRNRNKQTSLLVGDSGGFQIGKGVWEGDWKDPNCPKASKKRLEVLTWLDNTFDYAMTLDIPAWVARSPAGQEATGIRAYSEAVEGTEINNDYFMQNRNGECKYLNVLQGETHTEADDWYHRMKKYCDPKQYPDTHFNGWAMGGQNMCDVDLVLRRLVSLMRDGLIEKGVHNWMHFLGTSKLEWALLLTDIQRAMRKHYNSQLQISYDCASPFLATANGQVYCQVELNDKDKWVYRMVPSIDDKGLAQDTTPYSQAFLREGKHTSFLDSPVTNGLLANDICKYAPGDLNKVGNEGKTSWDSFSYCLLMAHNVWTHIYATQEANRQYENGIVPKMLVSDNFQRLEFNKVVDEIIGCADSDKALDLIKEYNKFWMSIIGTRGATGKKTVNATTKFNELFTEA